MTLPDPPDRSDRSTRPTAGDVDALLSAIEPATRREDAGTVLAMMREVTGAEPVLWAGSMVGFGRQPYHTADGRDREWFAVGLAARTAALTFYGLTAHGSNADLLERLGRHTTGQGCLYVRRLTEVDLDVLRELLERAWAENHVPD